MSLAAPSIWNSIATPAFSNLSPEAARAILKMKLSPDMVRRIHSLSTKSKKGTLTDIQRSELEIALQVAHFLTFVHSKARTALKPSSAQKRRKSA